MSTSTVHRGDVVIVEIPYLDASRTVRRPALVICDPSQMLDLIVAMFSSRIRSPLPLTHYLIDLNHSDWSVSGLTLDSVVRCDRLHTVSHADVRQTTGALSSQTMQEIDQVLKLALGMP